MHWKCLYKLLHFYCFKFKIVPNTSFHNSSYFLILIYPSLQVFSEFVNWTKVKPISFTVSALILAPSCLFPSTFCSCCFCSVAKSYLILCDSVDCNTPGFPVPHHILESSQVRVHCISDAIQPSHPLSSPSLPAFNLSQHQGLFQSVLRTRWSKYWSFSFNTSPSNEHSGLIFFRMDWLALLAIQGTLKSLLKHHNLKASILRCSAFFIVQSSYPYMTTENTIVLTRWTFAGKEMSLLFNVLSRLIITYLPRSKHLLILWLQSPYKVILEPPKIKSVIVSLSICHEVMGPDAMILVF